MGNFESISRQSKPFIDENLQFIMPQTDISQRYASPIYCHYMGGNGSHPLEINEKELYHAMADAERSYQAWAQMKEKINKIKVYSN